MNSGPPEMVSSSCSTSGTYRVRSSHCMSIIRHNGPTLSIISTLTCNKQTITKTSVQRPV
jgi:hypothetical protein